MKQGELRAAVEKILEILELLDCDWDEFVEVGLLLHGCIDALDPEDELDL